jgi:hypothetical protein
MKEVIVKIVCAFALFGLNACGENATVEIEDSVIAEQEKIATDSLNAIQEELVAVEDEVAEKEELLAQNLEEKANQKKDDEYIKTELNDVVVSRNKPNPLVGPDRGTGSGIGNGEEVFFGSGDGQGISGNDAGPGGRRKIVYQPKIVNPANADGVVSLKLIVDAEGNVTSSKVIPEKSTTNEDQLRVARNYGTEYRFESYWQNQTMTTEYITIEFKIE